MNTQPGLVLRALALAACLTAGCEDADAPTEPVWNKQPCAHCHMILSDRRYAAQLVTAAGDRLFFDDVGCLASYLTQHKPALGHSWVYSAGHFTDTATAHFHSGATTPMGFGFESSPQGPLDFPALLRAVATQHPQGAAP